LIQLQKTKKQAENIFFDLGDGRPQPEICFLPGRLRWTLLPKERYGNSLSGLGDRGSKTHPFNLEAITW